MPRIGDLAGISSEHQKIRVNESRGCLLVGTDLFGGSIQFDSVVSSELKHRDLKERGYSFMRDLLVPLSGSRDKDCRQPNNWLARLW